MQREMRTLLALLATCALLFGGVTAAAAHTALSSAEPAVESTIKEWPGSITLTFNEALQEISGQKTNGVTVNNSIAEELTDGEISVSGSQITVPVKENKSPGLVLVSYRVVSADGHPVEGEYAFTFAPNGEVTQSTATTSLIKKSTGNTLIYGASTVLIVASALFGLWAYRRKRD